MAANSFGSVFRFTTWGESHGPSIGVVIDGCPAGVPLCADEINAELTRRAPGSSLYTSKRDESDMATIESGVFEGQTTGAPISLVIRNQDADSSKYATIAELLRPGHANYTYLKKYGIFDYHGGGRASARETACRVAAGAVARKLLARQGVDVMAFLAGVGAVVPKLATVEDAIQGARFARTSALHAASAEAEAACVQLLEQTIQAGDSIGGVVMFVATGVPVGLGDPVYEKLDARLAFAMLGIPACKGFELGEGFASATRLGSEMNDCFVVENGSISPSSNHAGGTLGGISTGLPLYGRVAFKPTPSIFKPQPTVDRHGNPAIFELPAGSRHDPCVAIRAVPVVEAMCLVVLADALLMNKILGESPC